MALAAYDIHFQYSGAVSYKAAQSDPDASLGNYIASDSDRLYHTQGQVTVATTSSHIASTSFVGVDFIGDWILMITGTAAGLAAKIIAHDSGTGNIWLSHPLTGVGGSDYFRIHSPNNLFDDVLAAEALAGEDEFRGIFVFNSTGSVLTDGRVFLSPIFASRHELAVAGRNGTAGQFVGGLLPNENTEPDLGTTLADNDARFETLFDYDIAYDQASTFDLTIGNPQPLWIRRRVLANSGPQDDVVWGVVFEALNPVDSMALIVYSGEGFVPQVSLEADRFVYIGGGVRVTTLITDENENPLEEFDVEWAITGDGSIDVTSGQTDEDGETTVAYTAPVDTAKEGQSATLTAKVI